MGGGAPGAQGWVDSVIVYHSPTSPHPLLCSVTVCAMIFGIVLHYTASELPPSSSQLHQELLYTLIINFIFTQIGLFLEPQIRLMQLPWIFILTRFVHRYSSREKLAPAHLLWHCLDPPETSAYSGSRLQQASCFLASHLLTYKPQRGDLGPMGPHGLCFP